MRIFPFHSNYHCRRPNPPIQTVWDCPVSNCPWSHSLHCGLAPWNLSTRWRKSSFYRCMTRKMVLALWCRILFFSTLSSNIYPWANIYWFLSQFFACEILLGILHDFDKTKYTIALCVMVDMSTKLYIYDIYHLMVNIGNLWATVGYLKVGNYRLT